MIGAAAAERPHPAMAKEAKLPAAASTGTVRPRCRKSRRVMVPVSDQDEAIAFYTQVLGFALTADAPFGEGSRWVEVTPPGGGTALALVPPQGGDYQPGRLTGIALGSTDPRGDHEEFAAKGVDAGAVDKLAQTFLSQNLDLPELFVQVALQDSFVLRRSADVVPR